LIGSIGASPLPLQGSGGTNHDCSSPFPHNSTSGMIYKMQTRIEKILTIILRASCILSLGF
jgi:hypothetical protein